MLNWEELFYFLDSPTMSEDSGKPPKRHKKPVSYREDDESPVSDSGDEEDYTQTEEYKKDLKEQSDDSYEDVEPQTKQRKKSKPVKRLHSPRVETKGFKTRVLMKPPPKKIVAKKKKPAPPLVTPSATETEVETETETEGAEIHKIYVHINERPVRTTNIPTAWKNKEPVRIPRDDELFNQRKLKAFSRPREEVLVEAAQKMTNKALQPEDWAELPTILQGDNSFIARQLKDSRECLEGPIEEIHVRRQALNGPIIGGEFNDRITNIWKHLELVTGENKPRRSYTLSEKVQKILPKKEVYATKKTFAPELEDSEVNGFISYAQSVHQEADVQAIPLMYPHKIHENPHKHMTEAMPPYSKIIPLNQVIFSRGNQLICCLCGQQNTTGSRSNHVYKHFEECYVSHENGLAMMCSCAPDGRCIYYTGGSMTIHQKIHGYAHPPHETYIIKLTRDDISLVSYDLVTRAIYELATKLVLGALLIDLEKSGKKKNARADTSVDHISERMIRSMNLYYGANPRWLLDRPKPESLGEGELLCETKGADCTFSSTNFCPVTGIEVKPYHVKARTDEDVIESKTRDGPVTILEEQFMMPPEEVQEAVTNILPSSSTEMIVTHDSELGEIVQIP